MSKSRLEWKVGLFVIICLGLLGALLLLFSKGTTFWRRTYDLHLLAGNVSGLKSRATVSMAGVQIGSVSGIQLGPEGTNVSITLTIYRSFRIPTTSDFSIEQSGFLGDQYVSVTPHLPTNGPITYLQPGDVVIANSPWSLVSAANRVLTSLDSFDQAAASLKQTVDVLREGVLSPQTLSNFSVTISNLREASSEASITLSNLDSLVLANGPAINRAGSNLDNTLSNANQVVISLQSLISTNRPAVDQAISNLESATHRFDVLMANVQGGQGLAGKLLKDEKMAAQMSDIVMDLSCTTSNLNRLGLWRVLFPRHPREPKRPTASSPKDPSR